MTSAIQPKLSGAHASLGNRSPVSLSDPEAVAALLCSFGALIVQHAQESAIFDQARTFASYIEGADPRFEPIPGYHTQEQFGPTLDRLFNFDPEQSLQHLAMCLYAAFAQEVLALVGLAADAASDEGWQREFDCVVARYTSVIVGDGSDGSTTLSRRGGPANAPGAALQAPDRLPR